MLKLGEQRHRHVGPVEVQPHPGDARTVVGQFGQQLLETAQLLDEKIVGKRLKPISRKGHSDDIFLKVLKKLANCTSTFLIFNVIDDFRHFVAIK